MGVSTEAVQIVINVTDMNSGAVAAGVAQNLKQIGIAGAGVQAQMSGTAQSFQGFGVSGTIAGRIVKQNLEEVGKEALSTREKTRLLSEEFGIRIPRAMQSLIAESGIAKAALSSLTSVMVGLGAIQIGAIVFEALIDGAEKFYEKWIDVDGAIQKYNEQAADAASKKFYENAGVDQLSEDLQKANKQIDELNQKRYTQQAGFNQASMYMAAGSAGGAGALVGYSMSSSKFGMNDAAAQNAAQGKSDSDRLRLMEETHKGNVQQIEDAKLLAEARANANDKAQIERESAYKLAAEDRRFRHEQAQTLAEVGNRGLDKTDPKYLTVRPNAGATEESQAKQHADAQFQAQRIAGVRQAEDEIRKIHEQAEEAEASPLRKLEIERKAADADWVRQHGQNADVIADIDRRFYAEERKQAKDAADKQMEEAKKWLQSALDVFAKREQAQQEFGQRVDRIEEENATRGLQGFAKIHADAQREMADLQAEFANKTGANPADLQRGIAGIHTGEAANVDELRRRNQDETAQLESEARAKMLSSERNQTAAIDTEYKERTAKFFQELQNREIGEDDYNRRVLAAGELRDAEMVEAAQRAREKMAGEFTRFFSNPMQAMKEFGNKAAGEMASSLVQRMQNHVGSAGNAGSTGGIFDRIAGVATGHKAGASGAATHSAASAMISVGTAQISIGGANLAFGGAGPASASTRSVGSSAASGFGTSGGSTGLYVPEGGASAPAGSTAAPISFAGSTGAASPSGIDGVLGNAQQGMGLFSQGKQMFGGLFGGKGATSDAGAGLAETQSVDLSGTIGKDGNFNLGKSGTGMLNGGGVGANAMGAAGGAMGLFSAFEGNGGLGGALQGGMAGMQLGMSLGGPIGAAIGAAGGAILGAIGFGGKEKARVYDLKTVRPRIATDILSYQQGSMDYSSAYSDMQSLDMEAKKTLKAMGGFGDRYYWDTVIGEIHQAESKLSAEQRAGRSNYTTSAASYDIGADRVPRDGFAMIHENERIMPSDQNERITRAIEAGSDGNRMVADSGFGGDVHFHVNAIDSRSVEKFFMQNGHQIRASLNNSYSQNSGGADAY